ncbi:MAG: hypothetical protein HY002_05270 [Candidatus Rokubacteria bacterium]|nr:hypothetical protein [Candidatus Rokubacteria bacterium]
MAAATRLLPRHQVRKDGTVSNGGITGMALERLGPRAVAQVARAEVEAGLDGAGWPWSRRLSFWLDALLVLEEKAP